MANEIESKVRDEVLPKTDQNTDQKAKDLESADMISEAES